MVLRVGLVAVVLGFSSCSPCTPFEHRTSELCSPTGGASITAGQPFVLTAIVSTGGPVEASCTASVDGGVITLLVSGESCPRGSCSGLGACKPIVVKTPAECALPALEAGSYPVAGSTVTVTVGDDAGSGVSACP